MVPVASGRPSPLTLVQLMPADEVLEERERAHMRDVRGVFGGFFLLAAVAARTRRVSLGTAVLLPALRHPLLLAHAVATVDRVSEGRLILGVGLAGDTPATRKEFEAAGVAFRQRVGRCVETLDICRALWRGEGVSHQGRYFTLDDVSVGPTPHRQGGPPIWWGGGGPTALREAARADGWFPIDPRLPLFREGWSRVQATAREAGRDPQDITPALYTTIVLGEAEWRYFERRGTRQTPGLPTRG